VIFQFSQYALNLMSLLKRNFTKQGPRGKIAGTFVLLSMYTVAGLLFALPFGDDAINIFEWLYKSLNGEDLDIRMEAQQMLADMFGNGEEGRRAAEAVLYGPTRTLTGLNVGQRVGFTSLMPEMGDPVSAIPALSTTVGKFQEYIARRNSGVQPIAAYSTLVSPFIGKGPTDLVKGFVQYPEEGARTRYGNIIKKADEMDWFEQFARGFGFQSASIAREQQGKRAAKRIEESTRNAERNNTVRLSKMLADAVIAENKGNPAEAERIRARFEQEMGVIVDKFQKDVDSGRMAKAIKPPSEQALREAVIIELYPDSKLNSAGKLKRQAMIDAMRTALVEDDRDDLIPEEEEEDEDAPLQIE
jgi:hypothetical protein